MVDQALNQLWRLFSDIYSHTGRPSIAPEQLFRALVLQVLYTIRSERLLMEQLDYNLLFRWFVGLSMDDPVWDHSSFSKNSDRLLNTETARRFFQPIRDQAQAAGLLPDEHFSVDGTLLEAWASMKSFKPKDGTGPDCGGKSPEVDFWGQRARTARMPPPLMAMLACARKPPAPKPSWRTWGDFWNNLTKFDLDGHNLGPFFIPSFTLDFFRDGAVT